MALADTSYTRQLLDAGPEKCANKLGEEAVETVIAGVAQYAGRASRPKPPTCSITCWCCWKCAAFASPMCWRRLEARMSQSGIAEKASRKSS